MLPELRPGARTQLERVPAGIVFREIAPSTVLQLVGARARALSMIRQAVEPLPAYRLILGPDSQSAPELIRSLLSGEATAPRLHDSDPSAASRRN